jgi:asparagine synthase (glutamine-hydrolysing)
MCGIAGFIDFSKNNYLQGEFLLKEMANTLSHRGPDGCGYKVFNEDGFMIGLGHRRLSIIDLSALGTQPMVSRCNNVTVTFNGEIYNYKEIREELKQRGHIFYTNSDTEVIIVGYLEWGVKILDKLIGMFAIVLYDKLKRKVYFIRDRAGVKPFYYFQNDVLNLRH